jgi:hypothetical protein
MRVDEAVSTLKTISLSRLTTPQKEALIYTIAILNKTFVDHKHKRSPKLPVNFNHSDLNRVKDLRTSEIILYAMQLNNSSMSFADIVTVIKRLKKIKNPAISRAIGTLLNNMYIVRTDYAVYELTEGGRKIVV